MEGCVRLLDDQQVLNADAEFPVLIVSCTVRSRMKICVACTEIFIVTDLPLLLGRALQKSWHMSTAFTHT